MDALRTGCFLVCLGLWFTGTLGGDGDGQCVWYGECGKDRDTGKTVNCFYNGTARPFQSSRAVGLFKEYCPDLYQGAGTKTCCSDDQLLRLVGNMVVPRQVLGRCPSCLHNFLNIYCYMTCYPQQSQFLSVSKTTPWVNPKTGQKEMQINEVEYTVSRDFAEGMFNSCNKVQLSSAPEPAIGVLCGHSANECTPQKWLDYMGNTANQQTPFQIDFNITDHAYINTKGQLITPQNASTLPCIPTHTNNILPCLCGKKPRKRVPFDKHFPPVYRTEQLIITRTGNHSRIMHKDPPPATSTTEFNPIFDKDFLHQVLALQDKVSALRAPYDNDNTVVLQDICFRLHDTECTILSILNYFQNNATILDRVVKDAFGFFILADYLGHFMFCVQAPESTIDMSAFNDSCLGTDGGPVYPWTALQGFDGENYQNSTALVITFIVNYDDDDNDDVEKAKVHAWEEAASQFLKDYAQHQPNMTVSLSSHTGHRGHSEEAVLIG